MKTTISKITAGILGTKSILRAPKDLTPKGEILGGAPGDPEDSPPGSKNHNETLVRAKDHARG